jgi:hypothetical protein
MNVIDELNKRNVTHAIVKVQETLPYQRTDTVVIISSRDREKVKGLGFLIPYFRYRFQVLERELSFDEAAHINLNDYKLILITGNGKIYEQIGNSLKQQLIREKYIKLIKKDVPEIIAKHIDKEYYNGGTNEIEIKINGLYYYVTYVEDSLLEEHATQWTPASYKRCVEVTGIQIFTPDDDEIKLSEQEKQDILQQINKHFEPLPASPEDLADIYRE